MAVTGTPPRDSAPALLETLRSSDVLAEATPDVLVVLLPDTGAFGAAACRKRLFARTSGDPRARPAHATPLRSAAKPAGVGQVTYPHDGEDLDTLLDLAIERARADEASVVHALELGSKTLGEIVDTLRARPAIKAGPRSTYPLDLAIGSLSGVIEHACAAARARRRRRFSRHITRGAASRASRDRSLAPPWPKRHPRRDATATTGAPNATTGTTSRSATCATCREARTRSPSSSEQTTGAGSCVVRLENDRFVGIHAADPLLADLVADRILLGALPEGERGER